MTDEEWDTRPSIRITNTMPENRKIAGLSDKAFRSYIEALCLCSRQETDGLIVAGNVAKVGPPKAVRELVAAGLLEQDGRDYRVHDYLKHQRSSAEVTAFRASRSEDGRLGAHLRWHVPRRKISKGCPYCSKEVESA